MESLEFVGTGQLLGELENRGYRLNWACKGYRGYSVQKILRFLNL